MVCDDGRFVSAAVLCREEAMRLQEHKAEFEALGVKVCMRRKRLRPLSLAWHLQQ